MHGKIGGKSLTRGFSAITLQSVKRSTSNLKHLCRVVRTKKPLTLVEIGQWVRRCGGESLPKCGNFQYFMGREVSHGQADPRSVDITFDANECNESAGRKC